MRGNIVFFRLMRTFSTPESALKGEITKLSIIECALAVAVYLSIALHRHTFRYFYLAIALAPLSLFRTAESTEWSLRTYQVVRSKVNLLVEHAPSALGRFFLVVEAFVFIPAWLPVLRVAGMVYGFARRPVRTILEMPRNWVRQALCTDFAHPPEALPGEQLAVGASFITFQWTIWIAKEKMWTLPFGVAIAVLLFLPPLFYRISFKATAVCYLPFLWVAQATAGSRLPLKVRLERVTKGELEKVRRWLAVFVLGAFGVVAALHFGIIDVTSVTSKFPTELAALNLIGVMKSFQWWHATLLADALLTFWLLFFSDAALARMDTQVWSEPFVANTVSMTSFFRGALAVLTMTHFCWAAILNVVPVGVRGFLSVL
jgi:hypothetical protein